MEIILPIIITLYAGTGVINILAYIPTIRDLTKNIASANIHSYIIWTLCGCVAFLYALLVISDLLLVVVTGLNFAACAVILFLSLRLKYIKK